MRNLPTLPLICAAIVLGCVPRPLRADDTRAPRPFLSEFMGINGHTVQFKPDLYAKVCRKVRDYHSLEWDLGKETDFVPRFPEARNRVNWDHVYGSWQKVGFETDVCIMFNNTPPDSWKDMKQDAYAYGLAFAKSFGPSSPKKLVTSVEIGNEPGHYTDEQYRIVFEGMARGFRDGDAKLKVVTCNLTTGKSARYEKSVTCVAGFEPLYDVLNIHTYAMLDHWPTWRRSHPEDPKTDFLKSVESLITWRNANAKDKEIWITEFGWDASTKPRPTTGDFAKWEGNSSDEKQAQYLVRAFLVFAAMDVERAYLYFFNDADEPSYHAASGITRNFHPKPSFHALAHLHRTLGDYRFHRAVLKRDNDVYAHEFTHGTDARRKILVAWSPTGSARAIDIDLPLDNARVLRAEKMPLTPGDAPTIKVSATPTTVRIRLDESPTYLWLESSH